MIGQDRDGEVKFDEMENRSPMRVNSMDKRSKRKVLENILSTIEEKLQQEDGMASSLNNSLSSPSIPVTEDDIPYEEKLFLNRLIAVRNEKLKRLQNSDYLTFKVKVQALMQKEKLLLDEVQELQKEINIAEEARQKRRKEQLKKAKQDKAQAVSSSEGIETLKQLHDNILAKRAKILSKQSLQVASKEVFRVALELCEEAFTEPDGMGGYGSAYSEINEFRNEASTAFSEVRLSLTRFMMHMIRRIRKCKIGWKRDLYVWVKLRRYLEDWLNL